MKLAVTAASGKLGSTVIEQLKNHISPSSLVGIARTTDHAKGLDVEIRKGDYNNRDDFEDALRDIDVLLLISGMDKPDKRISQHRNVMEAAKSCGVRKIVYSSIIGNEERTAFGPIVQSNRQTEEDVRSSGLEWVIGRNGLYIDPDLEYLQRYVDEGEIWNSAGDGKCAFTSRKELAVAYSSILLNDKHNGHIYNLVGTPITQEELTSLINDVYNLDLKYKPVSVESFMKERQQELGEHLGTIVGGIYEGIKLGYFDVPSNFKAAAGRSHTSPKGMIDDFKNTP